MTYDEALGFIHSTVWLGSKPGLSRTRELLKNLGDPQRELKFVHVAGTNGKGSVCKMLASVLQESGYKTGLYTSPYIERFNERLVIDGKSISDNVLASLVEEIRPFAEKMEDKPTEFKIITALGMLWFAREKCDIVVLEVGMGGELDSTNIIDTPELAVITTIGLDHTQYLGETYGEIASAKAGIIKSGGDVAIYGRNAEAETVIAEKARSVGAHIYMPDYLALKVKKDSTEGIDMSYGVHKDLHIPLFGTYQAQNAALALTCLEVLKKKGWAITEDSIRRGLAKAEWRGRFELIHKDPAVILDGGHNPEGVRSAVESLKAVFPGRRVHFLMGVMADKDVEHMLMSTKELAIDYVTVRPDNPRAMAADELANRLGSMGCIATPSSSVEEGVRMLMKRTGEDGLACCLGSLYMSADVRKCFRN